MPKTIKIEGEIDLHILMEISNENFTYVLFGPYITNHPTCDASRFRSRSPKPELEPEMANKN